MLRLFLLLVFCLGTGGSYAQDFNATSSPYKTSWIDGAISAGGIGLTYWGFKLMQNKKAVTETEIQLIDRNLAAAKADIPAFDRWTAGFYNPQADKLSDVFFYTSFGLPLLLAADKGVRSNAAQIGLLYLETMAITGALFTQVNGRVNRIRPQVYNQGAGNEVRLDDKSKNSFYGGHVTAAAAASFFAAKVFNDFHPDSPAGPYIWAGAALLPAAVGYLRLEAGKHFLSDNLLGYLVGAGAGILVPHLHKYNRQFSISTSQSWRGGDTILLNLKIRL